ncbi:MAG: RHS repeat protein [Theionarchaea archaeon]|nr:RHS repeat protein [Theionarchaea archaeon]
MVTSITDAEGNTSRFEYDILGRVTKKINPDLTEVEAVYNDQNNYITIYDELDHYIIKYYDGIGRLTKTEWYISPTSFLTETYTYNYLDKVVTRTDPGGHVYFCEYDSHGRPIKIYNPDSTYRQVHYVDTTGTVTVIDENQHKKEYHYNRAGQLVWVKEYTDSANYYLTQYTYDSSGNLTSFTDANGNTTFYEYDSLFGVTRVTYPDSTVETFSYDAAGNVLSRTDADGTTEFTYNAISQLLSAQYPNQTSITFEYDANGNRTLMTDPEGTTSHIYDNRNRLISETRLIDLISIL